jgi:hypothetical protein
MAPLHADEARRLEASQGVDDEGLRQVELHGAGRAVGFA